MNKDMIPEGFTLTLALVDAIPVLFFSATMILLGVASHSALFLLGAALVLFAGAAKVLWKIIVVLRRKNIWWMFLQMRILMPIGGVLMILAVFLDSDHMNMAAIKSALFTLPSAPFFGAGILGMALMTIFAFTLDSADARSNWIEQITNGAAQAAFFFGVLVAMLR